MDLLPAGRYRIVDLSHPLTEHWRWPVKVERVRRFEDGSVAQSSCFTAPAHAFTHVDAPVHFFPGAPSIEQVPLERLFGPAAVLDLRAVAPNQAVTADDLARAGAHLRAGDIALLMTAWPERRSVHEPAYWAEAPYLTRDAAEWLAERGIVACGYDFPQDYCIRILALGTPEEQARLTRADNVTHDVLLPRGIPNIEYLRNLDRIGRARALFCALPLALVGSDGSPVRAVAIVAE